MSKILSYPSEEDFVFKDNIVTLRGSSEKLTILFWTSTCPYCMDFIPTFIDTIQNLPGSFGMTNLTYGNLANKLGIDSVPYILEFNGQKVRKFEGSFTKEDLAQFSLSQGSFFKTKTKKVCYLNLDKAYDK